MAALQTLFYEMQEGPELAVDTLELTGTSPLSKPENLTMMSRLFKAHVRLSRKLLLSVLVKYHGPWAMDALGLVGAAPHPQAYPVRPIRC